MVYPNLLALAFVIYKRYGVSVRNITVTLDEDTYRRARMAAAERDTSVSALVKHFLQQLGSKETEIERLKREERALRERITAFRAADRLSRDDVHRRG
jgi:uncharacterized protein YdaU (DUF1376 family)